MRIVSFVACLLLICFSLPGNPGDKNSKEEVETEWAFFIRKNPWDMDSLKDIADTNLLDVNFEKGILTGKAPYTEAIGNPVLLTQADSIPGSARIDLNLNGLLINTKEYSKLSFRMYASYPEEIEYVGRIFTPADPSGSGRIKFISPNGENGLSEFFRIKKGWNIYSLDLSRVLWTIPGQTSCLKSLKWGGSEKRVSRLMIIPYNWGGIIIKLDWVKLKKSD